MMMQQQQMQQQMMQQQQMQQQMMMQRQVQSARQPERAVAVRSPDVMTLPAAPSVRNFKYGFISAGRDFTNEGNDQKGDTEPEIPITLSGDQRQAAGMGYGTKHPTYFRYISQRGKPKQSHYFSKQHHFDVSQPETYLEDYSNLNHPSQFAGPNREYFSTAR
jgi:hypothetical protein